jgi:hypothetical protein
MRQTYKSRRSAYRFLVGKPEERRSLGKPRHRWEGNIKMDPQEVRWRIINWIHLAQNSDRWLVLVNTEMNLP